MKKILTVLVAAALVLPTFALSACGTPEVSTGSASNGNESVYGKYYGVGLYDTDGDEERGFIELANGKCTASLDSRAYDFTYSVDGSYLTVAANPSSADYKAGIAGFVNNGVILTVCDGTFVTYCKQGKKPADIFAGLSARSGKYTMYGDGVYQYSQIIYILGDYYLANGETVGKIEQNDTSLAFVPLFDERDGYIENGQKQTFAFAGDNALSFSDSYDYGDGPVEYTTVYCKVGYGADGKKLSGEYIATINADGEMRCGYPAIACTFNGKLYLGMHSDAHYQDMINQGTISVEEIDAIRRMSAFYPHKRDSKFLCYNTEPDGSGQDFDDGMPLTSDITLYAQWSA